ncbi:uncharacterized protein B0I36DRAFT_259765 [Microdochium trichocladiopsis]|uniref:RRM domain-containing protein n=1 Tax=Microdochium trichocladiopsis TaxID=1682393 RepID=A0A9P8YK37_9PEZI|nr:uncharacterized protein B0I36DRAFT_259765 [Microdochium trichocladiopsis]KAH7040480.1 hypothetical protein B0I36DRAFT_259765 [Microdochium trichocladiopsis]
MAGTKKVKAAAPKRKAPEEASPVATKKVKSIVSNGAKDATPVKPAKKSKKVEEPEEEVPVTEADEEHPFSDDDDNVDAADEAQALAKKIDSDDEDEAEVDSAVAFKKGQDVGKIPKPSRKSRGTAEVNEEPGVVYIGRLPHGFYEHELRGYFSQFGEISKLRLSRNKQTGASKHFAFIEFAEESTAEIVAKTMDKYLLFGHILTCKVVPKSQVHESLWKGSNKRFKKIPWNKMAGAELKKPRTESGWAAKIEREDLRRLTRSKKLKAMGYDFDVAKLKTVEGVPSGEATAIEEAETPKAIEAAPAVEEPVVEEQTAPKVTNGTKGGKKGKAGAKGKKAKA